MRWWRHSFADMRLRRAFPRATLEAITRATASGEARHRGEVCFAVEPTLPLALRLRRITPRARAEAVFAEQRVWDTEDNTGVLIYVLLAERAIEIVADRGIAARIPPERWQAVCAALAEAYRRSDYLAGSLAAIDAVHAMLAEHFPHRPGSADSNELPDAPVVL